MAKQVRIIEGDGPIPCNVALLGEAPGKTEHIEGRPFCGPSGAVLDVSLQHAHIPRHQCYVSNVYKCWPGRDRFGHDLTPNEEQVKLHAPLLHDELDLVKPKFIGTVGRVATRIFLGDVSMESVHGIPHLRNGRIIVPIVHPAAGFRPGNELAAVWSYQDLHVLGALARGKMVPFGGQLHRPYSEWLDRKTAFADPAVDTEGDLDEPQCLSIASSSDRGFVVAPKDVPKLTLSGSLKLHYALHDLPILEELGLNMRHLEVVDTMVYAYILGEPQGLKDLTRRFLGYSMPEYPEIVRPAYLKALRVWLRKAMRHDWGVSEPELKTVKGRICVYQPQPLNRRLSKLAYDAADPDKHVDLHKRVKAFSAQQIARIEAKTGPLVRHSHAFKLLPKESQADYAGRDAANTYAIEEILRKKLDVVGLLPVAEMDCSILPMLNRMQRNGVYCDTSLLKSLGRASKERMDRIEKEVSQRWYGRRISLSSSTQVSDLLYKRLRLPVLRQTKTGKGSTDKMALELLKNRHLAAVKIREYRSARKNYEFSVSLPKFVQADGKIRSRIKYTRVVSGRLSMADPNMQQIPVRTEDGREIRNAFCIQPNANLVLGSWDYDQIEMKVMASLSADKALCAAINSGKDIHVETAARLFGGTYKQLLEGIEAGDKVAKLRRTVTKNLNYGLIYMIGPYGLYDNLRLVGIHEFNEDDCARFIREWTGKIYPRVQVWREEYIAEARRKGASYTLWGRPRWLPALYWPESLRAKRNEAERQCISHRISGTAADILKRAMARLWQEIQHEKYRVDKGFLAEPLLQIHDELLWELHPRAKPWIGDRFCAIMNADSASFKVPITASYAFGQRWGELK